MEKKPNHDGESPPGAGQMETSIEDMDEFVWTAPPLSASNSLHVKMRAFEHEVRCQICHEFFQNPVSVMPCLHSFCSECIRSCFKESLKGLKRSAWCPKCREPVNTGGSDFNKCLVPNRTVAEMVGRYQVLRGDLRKSLCQLATQTNSTGSDGEQNETMKRRSSRQGRSRNTKEDEEYLPGQEDVAEGNVTKESSARRKPLPATHYKFLKHKQLVELCRTHGLSTKGSDKDLRARHEAFAVLYNSECDSFNPRPIAEIAKEITRREQARNVRFLFKSVCIMRCLLHLVTVLTHSSLSYLNFCLYE